MVENFWKFLNPKPKLSQRNLKISSNFAQNLDFVLGMTALHWAAFEGEENAVEENFNLTLSNTKLKIQFYEIDQISKNICSKVETSKTSPITSILSKINQKFNWF